MKKQLIFLSTILILLAFINELNHLAYAQTIEFNTKQNLTISNPGFLPFSSISNTQFKDTFSTVNMIDVEFLNFLGNPCNVAPAADFGNVAPAIRVSGNGSITLDFSSKPNGGTYGLSIVPEGGACIFDIIARLPTIPSALPPPISTGSSSGSSSMTTTSEVLGTLDPNSLTIIGAQLPDELVSLLSNAPDNKNCQSSFIGINALPFNQDSTYNSIFDSLTSANSIISSRVGDRFLTSKAAINAFTLAIPKNKKLAKGTFDLKLTNTSDETKIYATVILPTEVNFTETPSSMGGKQIALSNLEVTLETQVNNAALAAVQHVLISATMPWQLSNGTGFFVAQGGGCLGPYCTLVESGMVVLVPGGACIPEKLNKRKAGYPTVNQSKFFAPFSFSSMTIQLSTKDIVNPKRPLVAKAAREKAYLILQPVPPKAMIVQQLMLSLTDDSEN